MTVKLVIGGSPCTHFSIMRSKDRETSPYNGVGWELFENYLCAIKKFKPDHFFYENNQSARPEIKDAISELLNTTCFNFDSALLTAQSRKRFYCFDPDIKIGLPEDRGLVLRDVLEKNVDEKYFYDCSYDYHGVRSVCATLHIKGHDIVKRVNHPDFKAPTLTTVSGGSTQKKVMDPERERPRKLTPVEYERLQGFDGHYTEGLADTKRWTAMGNGWTVPVVQYILSAILKDVSKDERLIIYSMYDGIGTGRYVLDLLGFSNIEYHAWEIDMSAISVAKRHYPDIIEEGDAFGVRG